MKAMRSPVPDGAGRPDDVQQVSPAFRKEATRAVVSIAGFICVYLLLITFSVGLMVLCCYAGVMLITFKASLYTLVIGVGIMGFGVMIFVFLIKFLFATSRVDESDAIEITAKDHPLLYDMINGLATEVGTSRPKKIFLSPDVNASVSYNSSFWSMFLPIRKNLKIGLGLVNAVNVSELKAVIAHEFGHFSQKSMKVGSWVYQVNRIIHDMLFNNQSYGESLDSVSRTNSIFSVFAALTIQVVKGIQWLLQGMYTLINKNYLSLSRQMEFHADLVAASLCGSNNIISALKRAEFAGASYGATLQVCNELWDDRKKVANFYASHRTTTAIIAAESSTLLEDGLPVIVRSDSGVTNRVNVKDQWASHPTIEEREAYLAPFNLTAAVDKASAWTLFHEDETWQQQLTGILYRDLPLAESKETVDQPAFKNIVETKAADLAYPEVFKDFYANRLVPIFDVKKAVELPYKRSAFSDVLTEEAASLPKAIQALKEDMATLQAIVSGDLKVKSFDFEGTKYKHMEAAAILATLQKEVEEKEATLSALDEQVFRFFYHHLPLKEAEGLRKDWQQYFEHRQMTDNYFEKVNEMMDPLGAIYRGETIASETIVQLIANLKETHEPGFKTFIREYLQNNDLPGNPALKEKLSLFAAADFQYFSDNQFFETELTQLNTLVQELWDALTGEQHALFRRIATRQAASLEVVTEAAGCN